MRGREQISSVHARNKKLADGLDLADIAERTSGLSGADLENLMNESAILAARREKPAITIDEVNDASLPSAHLLIAWQSPFASGVLLRP